MSEKIKSTTDLAIRISKLSRLCKLSIFAYNSNRMDKDFLLHLTTLTHLQKLRLCGKKIRVDDIEELFAHLSNLQHLDLSGAKSKLEEWVFFDHLTNLQHLILRNCIKPFGIDVLRNLEELVLCDTRKEPEDYYDFDSLAKLTRLELTNNWPHLEDADFEKMTLLPSLNELDIASNSTNLTKQAINLVCVSMQNLTTLSWSTDFPDEDRVSLTGITALHNLQFLLLSGPTLDSAEMRYLFQLSHLTHLNISNISDETAQQVLLLTNLRSLMILGDFNYPAEYFAQALPNVHDLQVYGNTEE